MYTRVVIAVIALAMLAAPTATRSQPTLGDDPPASRYFPIEWQVDHEGVNTTNISGYVQNQYGATAGSVRLVVEMLDASQTVVSRRYEWLGRMLSPFTRSYFEIAELPAAARYRVAVDSFDWIPWTRSPTTSDPALDALELDPHLLAQVLVERPQLEARALGPGRLAGVAYRP